MDNSVNAINVMNISFMVLLYLLRKICHNLKECLKADKVKRESYMKNNSSLFEYDMNVTTIITAKVWPLLYFTA